MTGIFIFLACARFTARQINDGGLNIIKSFSLGILLTRTLKVKGTYSNSAMPCKKSNMANLLSSGFND